jgi:alkanesulfonate monooxygenase SsuD/methylene tetrahydromethanopterin reductase-like flavin-dependent oxidoreductase (luciferase family)
MSAKRELRLGTTIHGAGATKYGWRQEGVAPDASICFAHYAAVAQKAEAAKLDFVFIVDSPNITPDSAPHFLNRMAGGIFRAGFTMSRTNIITCSRKSSAKLAIR